MRKSTSLRIRESILDPVQQILSPVTSRLPGIDVLVSVISVTDSV